MVAAVYADGELQDAPGALAFLPFNLSAVVAGLVSAYLSSRVTRRLGDDAGTSRTWACACAVVTALAYVGWTNITLHICPLLLFIPGSFIAGIVLIGLIVPAMVLGIRRLVTPKRVVETGEVG